MNSWTRAILFLPVAVVLIPASTLAQIVPDTTLPNNSTVTPDSNRFIIDGGTEVETNLFHSFEQFSLPSGNEAFFNHSAAIENIFTRVTGDAVSNIDGVLRANNANLFLLNPNGIAFGANARLDIGGSFFATTADQFNFADGTQFGATPSANEPLLAISTPVGLQFGTTPGNIRVRGPGHNLASQPGTGAVVRSPVGGLQVEPRQSLTLVGSGITIEGGNLIAPQGDIQVGSVAANSPVDLDTPFRPNYDRVEQFRPVQLSQRASIDASGAGGGDIDVQSQRLSIIDGSTILSITEGSDPGGTVNANVTEAIELVGIASDRSVPSSILTETLGTGSGGQLNLNARQLFVRDGAQVSSSSFSPGRSGDLTVNVSDRLELSGTGPNGFPPSSLASATVGFAPGGNLEVNANRVILQDRARITTDTIAGEFPAGNLTFNVNQLSILDRSEISAKTFGSGNAGNISVRASDFVEVSGGSGQQSSAIFSQVELQRSPMGEVIGFAMGDGGNIDIATPRLSVFEGGQISASTVGEGSGGTLSIDASELVEIVGSRPGPTNFIPSALTAVTIGPADAGDITVNTERLVVQDGGQLTAGTNAPGNGGNLRISADETIHLSGITPDGRPSRLTVRTEGPGDAGTLTIEGDLLSVSDGAEINVNGILRDPTGNPVRNLPIGAAGNLEIAVEDLYLNDGRLTAETTSGAFGNIIVNAEDLRLLQTSQVTTNAIGAATGGNIEIDTETLAALENSDISANAEANFGGRVIVNTEGIFGTEFREDNTPASDITATSELGPAFSGIVEINTPDVDPTSALIELEDRPVNAAIDVNPCVQGSETEFVRTGRGGLPPTPDDAFTGNLGWEDWRITAVEDTATGNATAASLPQPPTAIHRAQNWTVDANGELVLTAPDAAPSYRLPSDPSSCTPATDKRSGDLAQTQSQQFRVRGFRFVGNTVFSSNDLATATRDATGKPISFDRLQQVAQTITNRYTDQGYITTGAYVPPQTTQNRIVTIRILEGSLEDIRARTSGNLDPNYVIRRIQRVADDPVNQTQLLEALQLLQLDPRIHRLSAELTAGVRPGTNLLDVTVEETAPFTATVTLDNDRSPSVGSFRQQATTRYANLLGRGDVARVTYTNTEGSDDWELAYAVPLNSLDGTLSVLYSTADSRIVEAPFEQVDIEADARTYELSYRQPLLRRVRPKSGTANGNGLDTQEYVFREFALGLSASRRESQTSILDRDFPLSPGADDDGETRISALRFFQDWTQRDGREVLALRSEFSLGLDWFDATANDSEPDGEFFAWRGQAQWVRRLSGESGDTRADTRLLLRGDAQLSSGSLVPIEQFSLGGRQRMRGYRQDVLLADSGLFASAEVQLPLLQFWRRQGTVWVAPFVDAGTVWNGGDRADPDTSTLVSTGLGLRLQLGDRLSAALDWGIPLVELDTGDETLQENGVYFSVRFNPL